MSVLSLVRAEWTKARTVRSTWWSLVVAVVLCVGPGVLIGSQFRAAPEHRPRDLAAADLSFYPLLIGQIALVVFGVLVVSAEYTTGTIRASLAAVPRRGRLFAAKALVTAGVAGVFALVVVLGTFLATQGAVGEQGASLGDPGVPRAVLGAAVYLTAMCVFAMGVATMLRSSALALGILLPLLFLNSQGLASLPAIRSVTQYLPDQAGAGLMRVDTSRGFMLGRLDFGIAGAYGILLLWVTAALVGGYVSLRRRDA